MRWILATVLACGCVLTENERPRVLEADVSCGWDGDAMENVWRVSAVVQDPNGDDDVWAVQAVVIDPSFGRREVQDTLDLWTSDGRTWETERLESGTALWCDGFGYEVDVVAQDQWGAIGRRTIVIDPS